MNILNDEDYKTAQQMRRISLLGASPKDFVFIFPAFFEDSLTEQAASAKAVRTYNSLKPKHIMKPVRKRPVYFPSFAKPSKNHKLISNFGIQIYIAAKSIGNEIDLNEVFIDTYESWLSYSGDLEHNLSFQQAYSVFKYIINHIDGNQHILIKKCKSCTSCYVDITYYSGREVCPYCKKSSI